MLKTEAEGGVHNSWARVCDTCRSAACAVYCRADSAYLCRACDARIHSANPLARRHDRVWVCEACERAPAAFVCKADSASLCTACDAEIHSANPLARRHQRVPILPLSGFVNYGTEPDTEDVFLAGEEQVDEEDEDEAASWLLLNNNGTNNNNNSNMNLQGNGFLFGREVDEYLDLVEYNNNSNCSDQFSTDHHHNQQPQQYMNSSCVSGKNYGGDRVVPIQQQQQQLQHQHHHDQSFQLGLNCDDTSKHGFHFNGFISHSVSIPSADVGVVPESAMSDISVSHTRPPKGTIDLFSGTPVQAPTQLTPMDRVARVQRYRDKKKTRKFEKTIRYASRKAYAETRPRIKGRFAKRTDAKDVEVDQAFSATFMAETGYGIVPSF